MKGFRNPRPLPAAERRQLHELFGDEGSRAGERLQQGLRTVVLGADEVLNTAICNDTDPELVFAQPLYVLGRRGDVLLAFSTSGNARNVAMACRVARLKGLSVVGFSGASGGLLARFATVCIRAPATETYLVQEYHLPLYHCLCALLEDSFYPATEAGH